MELQASRLNGGTWPTGPFLDHGLPSCEVYSDVDEQLPSIVAPGSRRPLQPAYIENRVFVKTGQRVYQQSVARVSHVNAARSRGHSSLGSAQAREPKKVNLRLR